ncbi:hypothetical protein ACRE_036420 [Hapsidospora chrysogenum ATCC 11550]|uniref:Uncharacterized protein n=1 Tax=Hapsidospora chrysogenum (strain ATCC 11550 / CBS 779.69 / DSM 880 / IAM 14645 / JCM 23072 / IMI 49137) TaxID=857340 RepID=A0A086T8A8_HAPC1|nr:hypothetical protein ACRE_036420 [Hapsidospora chrysogenum ATCC 11550]
MTSSRAYPRQQEKISPLKHGIQDKKRTAKTDWGAIQMKFHIIILSITAALFAQEAAAACNELVCVSNCKAKWGSLASGYCDSKGKCICTFPV